MWQLSRRAARECCGLSDAVPAWLSIRSSMHLPAVLLTLTPLLPLQIARAQETGTIAGVVRARETGVPLWDARVTVAGTRFSARADSAGRYTISDVRPGTYRVQALIIGYAIGEVAGVVVTAGQTTTADFQLTPLAVALQEVVVVGYGTQVRRDVTGSVASVGSDNVHEVPKVNAIEAIKGRVPGVDIVTTGNKPGDGIRVRLRGERSLKASNDPLYVLDGIPIAGGVGDLSPRDIESIEVLKDASATAIYGSRGANGIVLITTRKGRPGATNITYDSYGGYQSPVRRVRVFNGLEFAEYKREANRARGQYRCDAGQLGEVPEYVARIGMSGGSRRSPAGSRPAFRRVAEHRRHARRAEEGDYYSSRFESLRSVCGDVGERDHVELREIEENFEIDQSFPRPSSSCTT